jgi:hypothetical protein
MRIDIGGGPSAPALTLERPLRCGAWPCCCKLQELHVFTGAGSAHGGLLIGSIRQRCACSPSAFFELFVGEDRQGPRYTINGPCLIMDNAMCDSVFTVCDAGGMQLGSAGPNGAAEIRKLKAASIEGWLQV